MNDDRFYDLLERAMSDGDVPADASEAERAEVERALAAIGRLQARKQAVQLEAHEVIPAVRARFQRYVAADAGASRQAMKPTQPRAGMLGRLLGRGSALALAGSAASIGILAVGAVVLWQVAFDSPTSAYAQVVNPGDYVQVEGVVEESGDGILELKSELGMVEVEVSDTTTFIDAATSRDVSTLKRGDRLLVGGIAGDGRKLRAQTLALGEASGAPEPRVVTFKQLQQLRPDLEGRVVTYTISSDGSRGSVLIDAGDGKRYLVRVDGRSAEELLARTSTALGQRVKVQEGSGVTSGTFSLTMPPSDSPPRDPDKPSFVRVSGVITSVQVRPSSDPALLVDGVITVQSARGPATVIVRPNARILPGESGLTAGAGLRGEANGHTIVVSGGIDKKTGHVVADVIILGPRLERPGR